MEERLEMMKMENIHARYKRGPLAALPTAIAVRNRCSTTIY